MFQKSDKCRFEYPKEISNETVLEFDKDEDNEVIWYYLEKPPCKITGFRIKQKRTHGDQFLNAHSIPTRDLLACNTNVQLGCINHMYYATHYASKSTQEEDAKSYNRVCNAIVKRIERQASKLREEGLNMSDNDTESDQCQFDNVPSFVEGLSRLLSGISAHMCSNIVAAPLGHFIVDNDSRFLYSHEFSNLLLSQLEDYIEDTTNNVSFQLRTVKSKNDEKVIQWPIFLRLIIYQDQKN